MVMYMNGISSDIRIKTDLRLIWRYVSSLNTAQFTEVTYKSCICASLGGMLKPYLGFAGVSDAYNSVDSDILAVWRITCKRSCYV